MHSSLTLSCRPLSNQQLNEEYQVDQNFLNTVARDQTGRFLVRMPLCKPINDLGESRHMAVQRLLNLERRLAMDSCLAEEYKKFMYEYLSLGHMEVVPPEEMLNKSYYLSHHAVIKSSSIITKVRVVFDDSESSNNGVSLNDILVRGSTVQPDLVTILLRFHVHKFALTLCHTHSSISHSNAPGVIFAAFKIFFFVLRAVDCIYSRTYKKKSKFYLF